MADINQINRVFSLLGRETQPKGSSDPWGSIINNIIDAKSLIILNSKAWSFAVKFLKINSDCNPHDPRFRYGYTIPTDCLKVLEVYNTPGGDVNRCSYLSPDEYSIHGCSLSTDEPHITIQFISRKIEFSSTPQEFLDAIAYMAASEAALILLENSSLAKAFFDLSRHYETLARKNDIQPGLNRKWRDFSLPGRNHF